MPLKRTSVKRILSFHVQMKPIIITVNAKQVRSSYHVYTLHPSFMDSSVQNWYIMQCSFISFFFLGSNTFCCLISKTWMHVSILPHNLFDFSLGYVSIGNLLYISDSCMILIQVCSVHTFLIQAMVSSQELLMQASSRFLFQLLLFPLATIDQLLQEVGLDLTMLDTIQLHDTNTN